MSVIPNLLTAKVIRNRMEDKNSLSQKGSLYVGTGVKTSTVEEDTVYVTASFITCPSTVDKSGQAIIVMGASNVGLTVGKIGPNALGPIVQSISGHIITGISQSTGGGKLQFFTTDQEFLTFGKAKETTITSNSYYEISANGSVFEGFDNTASSPFIEAGPGNNSALVKISLESGKTYLFAHTVTGSTADSLYNLPPLYINNNTRYSRVEMLDSVTYGGAGRVYLTYDQLKQELYFYTKDNMYGIRLFYKKIS